MFTDKARHIKSNVIMYALWNRIICGLDYSTTNILLFTLKE